MNSHDTEVSQNNMIVITETGNMLYIKPIKDLANQGDIRLNSKIS